MSHSDEEDFENAKAVCSNLGIPEPKEMRRSLPQYSGKPSSLPEWILKIHDKSLVPAEHGDEGAENSLKLFECLTIAWEALESGISHFENVCDHPCGATKNLHKEAMSKIAALGGDKELL